MPTKFHAIMNPETENEEMSEDIAPKESNKLSKKSIDDLLKKATAQREVNPYMRCARVAARDVPTLQAALDTMYLILEDYHHEWTSSESSLYEQANNILAELVLEGEY